MAGIFKMKFWLLWWAIHSMEQMYVACDLIYVPRDVTEANTSPCNTLHSLYFQLLLLHSGLALHKMKNESLC